jgi:hypothetical protein
MVMPLTHTKHNYFPVLKLHLGDDSESNNESLTQYLTYILILFQSCFKIWIK